MGRSIFFFLFILIYLGLEYYIYRSIGATLKSSFWSRFLLVFQTGSVLVTFLAFFLIANRAAYGVNHWTNLVFGLMITLFATKLVFLTFPLFEDVFRALKYTVGKVSSFFQTNSDNISIDSRRKFVTQVGLAVAAVPFLAFLYGVLKGRYDYTVRNINLSFYDLPKSFDGFRILQISDVHSGSFDNKSKVAKGLDLIQEQEADLILFTGDMVNNRANEVEPYKDLFEKLSAPHGKYSVLGNHDYGDYLWWPSPEAKEENLNQLKQHHADMGFNLMNNANDRIEKNGESIRLVGVENWGKPPFPQKGDLKKAFEGIDNSEFSILMSHDPSHWDAQVLDFPKQVHLTLSGHTHGMQFGVEIPGIKWSPVKWKYPRWAGLYEKAQQYLYVNRGFGFIGFPGRVGIWPEITVIELKKA
ncbi:MAG: metallophosphoesterase [Bacteroidota bacterium]